MTRKTTYRDSVEYIIIPGNSTAGHRETGCEAYTGTRHKRGVSAAVKNQPQ